MKVLITGITGMVGSHLAEYFLSSFPEIEVHGLVRWRSPLRNIKGILPRIKLHQGDLRDLNSLVVLLRNVKPDRIHHLAAQSYVDMSFVAPADTLNSNIIGTCNLLDAIRIVGINPRVHICSSSEVYGQVRPDEIPITEHTPLRPASPYAVSKVGEDMIAYQYGLSYQLDLVRTRMFTHTGPRRGDVFAESTFAKQIAMIEAGQLPPVVKTGNLDSLRTWADVRDAVRAYYLLVTVNPIPGEVYNIGGSYTCSVREMLDTLLSFSTARGIAVETDPERLRPIDADLQVPDTTKFRTHTGWTPEIPFEQTMRDLLDYWRGRIARGGRFLQR